ncbi:ABC-three component system protein [Paraburkholderia sp. CI3]|uniref:ABC-three component system protein n=1 Tax=Paraburkholderia sp. CI3 TaxID=2991060 RepID=UPI003D22430D
MHHLLRSRSGDTIALECFDDVSGIKDGVPFAEQDKSGLAHNPISDSAIDLWKTFANWLEGRRGGYIPAGTKFVLYVAQPYKGKIAQRLSDCQSPQEAKALIADLRAKFWGTKPAYEKRAAIPESLGKYLNVVLQAKDTALAEIIRSFTLERGIGSPYDEIAVEIGNAPVGAENVPEILKQLAGWIRTNTFKQVEKSRAVSLSRDEFFVEYLAAVRKFDRTDTILPSFSTKPTAEETQAELLLGQTYVRQLHLIEADQGLVLDAVNTYLMAASERTAWAKRGYVHRSSYSLYQDTLLRAWRSKRASVKVAMRGREPADFGITLLSSCLEADIKLQEKQVPEHFTAGSFHRLANTLEIGWHPDFAELLAPAKEALDAV